MDNHQELNGKIINNNKLGWVMNENKFKSDTLIKIIEDITTKNLHLEKIKLNLQNYKNKNDRKKKYKATNQIIKETLLKHLIELNKNDN